MVIVNTSRQFAFVENPKAGSTSIHKVLAPYQERPEIDELCEFGLYTRRHAPALIIREILGDRPWSRLCTFGIVRYPPDWFTSQLAYNYPKMNMAVPIDRQLTKEDVWNCVALLSNFRGLDESPRVAQWPFLCDFKRRPLVRFTVRFDALQKLWVNLCSKIGIVHQLLPHLNSTSHPAYAEWLSPGAEELIRELFKDDFLLYDLALDGE